MHRSAAFMELVLDTSWGITTSETQEETTEDDQQCESAQAGELAFASI